MIQRINLRDIEVRLNLYLQQNFEKDPTWFPTIDDDYVGAEIERMSQDELFGLMSPDDVEDVIATKLQIDGWILLKSTCFRSKPKFEFSMINRNGKVGLVQVKSGSCPDSLAPVKYGQYLTGQNEVFLFTTNPNPYPGVYLQGIKCFTKEEVVQWMKSNCRALSPTLKIKLSVK